VENVLETSNQQKRLGAKTFTLVNGAGSSTAEEEAIESGA
jgi:hypothetical protein